MKKRTAQLFASLFGVCLLLEVWGQYMGGLRFNIFTKPLLMPLLAMYFISSLKQDQLKLNWNLLVLAGLFFSWSGDIFLMFADLKPVFFLAGLSAFLITHIFYSISFLKIGRGRIILWNFATTASAASIIIAGIILMAILWPKLGEMRIPVLVYSCCISTMAVLSLWVKLKFKCYFSSLMLSGALLFMVSDSLIAINKFHNTFPLSGLWIILTYGLAQIFIVSGFIQLSNSGVGDAKRAPVE
jgi:uncharacterized membrane protein YhhN